MLGWLLSSRFARWVGAGGAALAALFLFGRAKRREGVREGKRKAVEAQREQAEEAREVRREVEDEVRRVADPDALDELRNFWSRD